MRVSLMITCLGDVLSPQVGRATVRILRRLGHEVVFPPAQTCCGQPFYNSGFGELARQQARHTLDVFAEEVPVVTPSGSCAAMIKLEYPQLFEHDAAERARAEALAARTYELSDFLVNRVQVLDLGARYEGRVTYHYACHLRGLGLVSEAEQLIQHVAGIEYVPLNRQDQCCGFGGSFSVRYPQISGSMVDDKVQQIEASGAQTVVATDAGCLMNIGGRLHRLGKPVRTMHLAELLDAGQDA